MRSNDDTALHDFAVEQFVNCTGIGQGKDVGRLAYLERALPGMYERMRNTPHGLTLARIATRSACGQRRIGVTVLDAETNEQVGLRRASILLECSRSSGPQPGMDVP
jgi:hypothetical protein